VIPFVLLNCVGLTPPAAEVKPRSPSSVEGPAGPEGAGGHQKAIDDDGDQVDLPPTPPPKQLSASAIDKRLRRVLTPRANGTYLVPQEVIDAWNDKYDRDSVKSMFEKSGYCPVRGAKMC